MQPINLYALIKDMVTQRGDPALSGYAQLTYTQADRLMIDIKEKIRSVPKALRGDASDLLGWARFKLESSVYLMPHHRPEHVLRCTDWLVQAWLAVPDEGGVIFNPATWSGLTMAARQACKRALEVPDLNKDYAICIVRDQNFVMVELQHRVTGRKRRIAVFTVLAFNQFIARGA